LKDKLNDENDPLITEMQNDVKWENTTDIFKKIGSAPAISDHVVIDVIQNYVDYLKKRTLIKLF
jgi:hydroxyethylthiazole kinase-like sugar kinase family protein